MSGPILFLNPPFEAAICAVGGDGNDVDQMRKHGSEHMVSIRQEPGEQAQGQAEEQRRDPEERQTPSEPRKGVMLDLGLRQVAGQYSSKDMPTRPPDAKCRY